LLCVAATVVVLVISPFIAFSYSHI
jgi:hypothetical protein